MAALQCEFCGGKLITKAGGICECDSCGMEFDKTWVKEKIQEIKGTVKVEGTVEVQGTVKIDGPIQVEGSISKENLLERGNLALADCHWKDAEDFFDRVLNLEPHSAQAYLGKYMAWMKAKDYETLKNIYAEADTEEVSHSYLKRAKEFADPALGAELAAMDGLRQSALSSGMDTRRSIYSKVKNRLYIASYFAVAAKTLDHTLLIDGQYDEITFDKNYNATHKYIHFCDEWYDVNKVFGQWEYASTCPGGQDVYDHVESDSNRILAVDHTGNVYVVDSSPDHTETLKKITNKWENVEIILSQSNHILAKTRFGTVYWIAIGGDEQKEQQKVKDWKNIAHIALNEVGAFGLSKDGRVYCLPLYCWDAKDAGEKIAAETAYWTDVQQIIVGARFIAGLTKQGEVKLSGTGGAYDMTYDIVEPVARRWKRVKHLDSVNDLTCIFEDGTACNVHDGELPGDWSKAKKLYHDENGYYGIGEDGSVCVGWKAPLPDGVLKEQGQCQLLSNGTLTGVKTKKKVLDFSGNLLEEEDEGIVLYEDGTVEVFEEGRTSKSYRTTSWKLFKSRKTFDQEYQQGQQKKQVAQDGYEKEIAQKLEKIEEERARKEEKHRVDEYERACRMLEDRQSESELMDALSIFEKLRDYRDSAEKIPLCQTALTEFREEESLRKKQTQYQKACEDMKRNKIPVLQTAIWNFKNLGDWKDSAERAQRCNEKIEILKRRNSLRSQKQNLEKELDGLGLFARKRKKEIATQIESIETEIDRINKEELN